MKKKVTTTTLFVLLFIGISLLLYPTLSEYWNSFHQSKAIVSYNDSISTLKPEDFLSIKLKAKEYNEGIAKLPQTVFKNGEPSDPYYASLLNTNNDSIMGYIEIDSIGMGLTIYHGTSSSVLSVGIGHLEGSSLPIGGESTHSILSGHRGLSSAKLFTDLDKVQLEDVFTIHILDEILTYQIVDISIVEPHEVDSLSISQGEDLCTLVTCTPYGVNSHRLLLTGKRIENLESPEDIKHSYIKNDAMLVDPILVAPIVAAPILLVLGIFILKPNKRD